MKRTATLVLLAVFIGGCRSGGTDPASLAIGDCFDVPTATDRIGDLRPQPCNARHGGEVFHVFDDAAPASAAYPTDPEWGERIYPICDPIFNAYTGTLIAERTDIDYRYLVPTPDRWATGDRHVTCFITALDGGQLERSFRASP